MLRFVPIAVAVAALFSGACQQTSKEATQSGNAVVQTQSRAPLTRKLAARNQAGTTARITSAYTKLDSCRPIIETDEEYAAWRCQGLAGVPLYLQDRDNRYSLSAGRNDGGDQCQTYDACAFNWPGDNVEWRLSEGRPFAIIFRLIVTPAGGTDFSLKKYSILIVKTVGKNSCAVAVIHGDRPDANLRAREAADQIAEHKAACITPVD